MRTFVDILKSEILKGLPGTHIQWQMAPTDNKLRDLPGVARLNTRSAAVLILLYPYKRAVYTVFIQRTDYDGVHSGQISFPGGGREPQDSNIIETALRETYEEIGVGKSKISVIGTLTPLFIYVSNSLVTPVIGWADTRPDYKIQTEEVVFLIEGDLNRFLDTSIIKTKVFKIRGEDREIKYFDYKGKVIWGATAMILNELLEIIKNANISTESNLY